MGYREGPQDIWIFWVEFISGILTIWCWESWQVPLVDVCCVSVLFIFIIRDIPLHNTTEHNISGTLSKRIALQIKIIFFYKSKFKYILEHLCYLKSTSKVAFLLTLQYRKFHNLLSFHMRHWSKWCLSNLRKLWKLI